MRVSYMCIAELCGVARDKREERDSRDVSDARRAGKAGLARRGKVRGPKFEVSGLRTLTFSLQPSDRARLARLA